LEGNESLTLTNWGDVFDENPSLYNRIFGFFRLNTNRSYGGGYGRTEAGFDLFVQTNFYHRDLAPNDNYKLYLRDNLVYSKLHITENSEKLRIAAFLGISFGF
jgi:hypothetical protein